MTVTGLREIVASLALTLWGPLASAQWVSGGFGELLFLGHRDPRPLSLSLKILEIPQCRTILFFRVYLKPGTSQQRSLRSYHLIFRVLVESKTLMESTRAVQEVSVESWDNKPSSHDCMPDPRK